MSSFSKSPRMKLFVEEVLKDPNGPTSEAAVRAGYPKGRAKNHAYRLMRHPEVKRAIEAKLEPDTVKRISEKLEVTVDSVLRDILETRDRAAEMGDNAQRNKSNELLGKYLGMWTEKKEVTVSPTVEFEQRYAEAQERMAKYQAEKAEIYANLEDLEGGEGLLLEGEVTEAQEPPQDPEPARAKNAQEKFEELQSELRCPVVPKREYDYDDWVERLVRRKF